MFAAERLARGTELFRYGVGDDRPNVTTAERLGNRVLAGSNKLREFRLASMAHELDKLCAYGQPVCLRHPFPVGHSGVNLQFTRPKVEFLCKKLACLT